MTAVLLGMAGANALNGDAETQPPDREPRKLEQPVRSSEGNSIILANRQGQPPLPEKTLKGRKRQVLARGLECFAQQQQARCMIGDGEGIAVAFVAQLELALVVNTP